MRRVNSVQWLLAAPALLLLASVVVSAAAPAGAGGGVSGHLAEPLRFVQPATLGGTQAKLGQGSASLPGLSLLGTTLEGGPGFAEAGDYVAVVRAGVKLAAGQAGPDGSFRLDDPRLAGASRFWLVRAKDPIPDLTFEHLGTADTGGVWTGFGGFSGRLRAMLVGIQQSGYSENRLCVWDGARWRTVWAPGSGVNTNGMADDGRRLVWGDYKAGSFVGVAAYDGASMCPVPGVDAGSAHVFQGGDGRVYVGCTSGYSFQMKGIYRLSETRWERVADAFVPYWTDGAAVSGAGELFVVTGTGSTSSPCYVKKWSGTAWVSANSPFDGVLQRISLGSGNGKLWALSGGQAAFFDGSSWSAPDSPSGLAIQNLYLASDGYCWAVVNNAGSLQLAVREPGGGWSLGFLMPPNASVILGEDGSGGLYVGGGGTWQSPYPVYRLPLAVLR